MIRVLVVDDHELVRSGITRMLADNPDIDVIGQASSGEEAIDCVRENRPDIVLMDIRMPGIGGLEATRRILRIDDSIRVIVVTACADDPYPARVMQSGATAYVTKGADIQEMVRAIRKAHSGQRYISPEIASQLALQRLDGDNESPFSQLSDRELQVTIMICSGDKVQAIADNLCLSPKTINSYRYRIFEKLNIHNDVELTHLALKHNILTQTSHENS